MMRFVAFGWLGVKEVGPRGTRGCSMQHVRLWLELWTVSTRDPMQVT